MLKYMDLQWSLKRNHLENISPDLAMLFNAKRLELNVATSQKKSILPIFSIVEFYCKYICFYVNSNFQFWSSEKYENINNVDCN